MVKLGTVVTDSLTGFTGTARGPSTSTGAWVYVEPHALHEGKPVEGQFFDEQRLTGASPAKVGGPMKAPTRNPDAPRS